MCDFQLALVFKSYLLQNDCFSSGPRSGCFSPFGFPTYFVEVKQFPGVHMFFKVNNQKGVVMRVFGHCIKRGHPVTNHAFWGHCLMGIFRHIDAIFLEFSRFSWDPIYIGWSWNFPSGFSAYQLTAFGEIGIVRTGL